MIFEVQRNFLSIIILFILFFSLLRQSNRKEHINQLFFYLIGFSILFLILSTVMTLVNGKEALFFKVALHSSVGFYYGLAPLFSLLWLFYVDFTIFQDKKRFVKLSIIPLVLFVINTFLVLLSYSIGLLFKITDQNVLLRGTYYYWIFILNGAIFLYAMYHIYTHKTRIRKKEFIPLLSFAIPPFLATIIFLFFNDVDIICNSLVVSHVLVYVYIQTKITSTDFLTGLFNKREFEFVVSQLNLNKLKNLEISGIMIDINNFKRINDMYGHKSGDEALISIANILKSSVRKQDYVFRVGGDEFVVLIISDREYKLDIIIKRILKVLEEFNEKGTYDFKISFSIGKGIYDESKHLNLNRFFDYLDEMMYVDKNKFNERSRV